MENRPVVIVDPRSSGVELAPAFKARGVPVIAISFPQLRDRLGYGTQVREFDFTEVLPVQDQLVEILRDRRPRAILAGAESGIPLAEALAQALTPELSNDPAKGKHRIHKAYMQEALRVAGLPHLQTTHVRSESEAVCWINNNNLDNADLVLKPPVSAGSDKVFHVAAGDDWRTAFRAILREPSNITGHASESVVIQERARGTEFAVGTVSFGGRHHLAHLIQYSKISFNGRDTVYDHVEFVRFQEERHGDLIRYTFRALDALGLRWGSAHSEIMMTPNGPRLIESTPRMCGGPVVQFAREATGSSQADKWIEICLDGKVREPHFHFKKSVLPVFLRSPQGGAVLNAEVFDGLDSLPTLFKKFVWFKNGDTLPRTVDYLTSIGIVALSGDRDSIMEDYRKIRAMNDRLMVRGP